jgi:hypothetical protein
MLVYIGICSLIGSLSVVFTQGLGGAIVHSFAVENQFTNWFVYLVLALTLITLAIEIIYLNKALNIFNTAVVTPTYYVTFTTLTIVSSIVFYRGFEASPADIVTCVFGFLIICSGVALLQHSKSDKGSEIDDGGCTSPQERLLPTVYDNEKFMTSDEEVNHIENVAGGSSATNNQFGKDASSSSLWRRSRGSLDNYRVEIPSSPRAQQDSFTDNISLDTIEHSSPMRDSGMTRERLHDIIA